MMTKKRKSSGASSNVAVKFQNLFLYLFLSVAAFLSIFPFFWMVVSTTNSSNDIISGKITFGKELMKNIHTTFKDTPILRGFKNSLLISVLSVIGTILISAMAAYGIQMFKSKGKMAIYRLFLVTMMIPGSVTSIPLYRLLAKMSWIDSFIAVIIPGMASVFFIFFFYQTLSSFPIDTIESARLDGAGEFYIFCRIVVPQLKSTFAAATIMTFNNSWNAYMWPLIILQSDQKRTLPLMLASISSVSNYSFDYGQIMLMIVITTLPIFLVFVTMQKYFVAGMIGASKS